MMGSLSGWWRVMRDLVLPPDRYRFSPELAGNATVIINGCLIRSDRYATIPTRRRHRPAVIVHGDVVHVHPVLYRQLMVDLAFYKQESRGYWEVRRATEEISRG